jgi:hypothetical protein
VVLSAISGIKAICTNPVAAVYACRHDIFTPNATGLRAAKALFKVVVLLTENPPEKAAGIVQVVPDTGVINHPAVVGSALYTTPTPPTVALVDNDPRLRENAETLGRADISGILAPNASGAKGSIWATAYCGKICLLLREFLSELSFFDLLIGAPLEMVLDGGPTGIRVAVVDLLPTNGARTVTMWVLFCLFLVIVWDTT